MNFVLSVNNNSGSEKNYCGSTALEAWVEVENIFLSLFGREKLLGPSVRSAVGQLLGNTILFFRAIKCQLLIFL